VVDSKKNREQFRDRCRAGFYPSGLQRDAIDMRSRNGRTLKYSCVLRWWMTSPKCGLTTAA